MKNSLLILVLFFISLSVNAQLAGTKWKGKVNIPKLTDVIFDFKMMLLMLQLQPECRWKAVLTQLNRTRLHSKN